MNWKLLTIPAVVFSSSLLLASACEPCEGDECNIGDGFGGDPVGSGGESSGGESSGGSGATDGGGTSSGGSVSSGGSGGSGVAGEGGAALGGQAGSGTGSSSATLDCQVDGSADGTPGSCEPQSSSGDANYDCEACVQELCCSEFEACNASDPVTACRFGSTLYDGQAIEGEFDCLLDCMRTSGYLGDEYELNECAASCGSAECNPDESGPAATDLMGCMLGLNNVDNPTACREACEMLPPP